MELGVVFNIMDESLKFIITMESSQICCVTVLVWPSLRVESVGERMMDYLLKINKIWRETAVHTEDRILHQRSC